MPIVELKKQWFGGYHLTFFNKINFYAGKKSLMNPEIGIDLNLYDRALTLNLVFWYVGAEVFHREYEIK
jgi:hypothetical protein